MVVDVFCFVNKCAESIPIRRGMLFFMPYPNKSRTESVLTEKRNTMTQTALYRAILDEVHRLTELPEVFILHSNLEECADARSVLVHALSRFLTDSQIATLMGRTRQGVNFIRMGWSNRKDKWGVASIWKEMSKFLASNDF